MPAPIAWTVYAHRATLVHVRHLTASMNFALVCALSARPRLRALRLARSDGCPMIVALAEPMASQGTYRVKQHGRMYLICCS